MASKAHEFANDGKGVKNACDTDIVFEMICLNMRRLTFRHRASSL